MSFTIKTGDTSPAIEYTLLEPDGTTPQSLVGASVRFHMRLQNTSGDAAVDSAATITDDAGGGVRYSWATGDTAIAGTYDAEFEVTFSDGTVETFPNSNFITVIIPESIA